MSREVDERILSMRFDNDQFEKGVKATIQLLDKFEKQLKFEGAEEGLKNVSKAAEKVDLSKLAESASVIEVKFSMMSVAVITAISNIVTSAQEAGTRLVKALSVDQINAGFDKYTQKTAAVQTIMNATGKSVEEVTAALAKLQWFSDETSYSFVDMTSNVGKFTSAGIKLNTAISAMQGIANAAADAGSTSAEASRAMYNFSQALAKGYVQLIDWKSIENANMATLTFKQTIIDSAVAMGTLTEAENGYIVTGTNATVTAANFNEELKQGWFTTEVLLDALGKYSQYSDAIYDVSDAFDTCADAIAATSAEGMELGQRAFLAAQQAKTFTEAIDATKDAVSSGWMESFEIIFGNFNESVELWTAFTNTLWDVFASGAENRNELLRGALSTGWNQLLSDYISDAGSLKDIIISTAKEQDIAIDDLIESSGSFEKSLKEGWLTADLLSDSLDNIINEFQTLSDEELRSKGYTEETVKSIAKLKKAMDDGSISAEDLAESIAKQSGRENIIEGISNAYQALLSIVVPVKEAINNIFPPMTAERLYELTERFKNFTSQMGLSEDAAEGLKEIVQDLLIPFKAIFDLIKTGTRLFIGLIRNIFSIADALLALRVGGGPIPELMKKIFGEDRYIRLTSVLSKLIENVSNGLSNIKNGFLDLGSSIKESEGAQTLLSGLYSLLSSIGSIVLDGVIGFFEFLSSVDMSESVNSITSLLGFLLKIIAKAASYIISFAETLITGANSIATFAGSIFKLGESESIFTKIGSGLSYLLGAILGFINGIGPIGIAIGALVIIIASFAAKILYTIYSVSQLISSVTEIFWAFSSLLRTISFSVIAGALLQVSVAIGILVASVNSLAQLDTKTLLVSLGAVVALMLSLVGVFELLANTIGKNKKMSNNMIKISASMVAFSAAIGILSMSLRSMSELSLSDIGKGLLSIVGFIGSIIAFAIVIQKIKIKNFTKIASYLISFSASIALVAVSLRAISGMNYGEILTGLASIVTIIGVMAVIGKLSSKVNLSAGAGILAMTLSLFLIISVLKKLSKEDPADLIKGLINYIPVFTVLVSLFAATNLAGKKAISSTIFILGISVAMTLIASAIKKMSAISIAELAGASAVLVSLAGVFALLLYVIKAIGMKKSVLKNLSAIGLMAIELSAAALLMSVALKSLGKLDTASLVKGTLAITAITAVFALVVAASKGATKAKTSAVAIGIALLALSASVIMLAKVDGTKLISSAASLTLILGSIVVALKVLQGVKIGSALGQAVIIGLILTSLIEALVVLQTVNVDGLIEKAATIAILVGSLSAIVLLISKFKSLETAGSSIKNIKSSISTTVAVLIPAIAMIALAIGSLYFIKDIDISIEKVGAIIGLITVLGGFSIALLALAKSNTSIDFASIGLFILSMIGVGVSASLSLLMLNNVDNAIEKAGALSLLIVALSGAAIALSVFKVDSYAVRAGVSAILKLAGGIAIIVGVAGLIAGVIGALDKNGKITDSINRGMEVLSSITTGLGNAISSFVAGFGLGLTSTLPQIGENIGKFGDNIQPFFSAFDGVDGNSVLSGVAALVECILGLSANDFLTGINNFLGFGSSSIVDLGNQLMEFGPIFMDFADSVQDIDPNTLDKIDTITKIVSSLSEAIPNTNGIMEFFTGSMDMEAFGKGLVDFASGFIDFYNTLTSNGDIDVEFIDTVTNAASSLAALNTSLPKTGGKLQDWIGVASLETFGSNLSAFASGFTGFYKTIKDLDVDNALVSNVTNAAKGFADVNSNLPSTGGKLQDWLGSPSLSAFGEELVTFGTAFVDFYESIKTLNVDSGKVESVANAADCISALNSHLPETGGIFEKWFGNNQTIGDFGSDLQKFGSGFHAFYVSIEKFAGGADVSSAVNGMLELIDGVSQGLTELDKNDIWGYVKFEDFGEGLRSFAQGLNSFYSAITSFDSFDRLGLNPIQKLQNGGESLISALVAGIDSKVEDLKLSGSRAVIGFSEGIDSAVSESNFTAFIDEFLNYIGVTLGTEFGNSMKMKNHSWRAVLGFAEGIDAGIPEVETSMQNLTDTVLDKLYFNLGINSPSTKFLEAANYCIQGFVLGIKNNSNQAYSGVSTLTAGILNQFRKDFKINSPSVVMRDEVGRYLVDGIAEGIESNMSAIDAAKTMASNIVSAFRDEFDKFTLDMTTFDLEYQLWEAYNPDATSDQIAQKKLEMLANKMTAQAEKVNLAEAQYKATLQALGENSEETQTAYNTYLQESLSMAQFANQMQELQKQLYDSTGSTYTKQNAKAFIDEYKDTLLENGFTEEEIARYLAQHEADVDANILVGTSVMDIVDKYMAQSSVGLAEYGNGVEVILDTTLADAMANAATSAGTSSSTTSAFYSSGAADAQSYIEGYEEAVSGTDFSKMWEEAFGIQDNSGVYEKGVYTGNATVDGVIDALANKVKPVYDAGKTLAGAADEGFRDGAEIQSPSKLMYRNGAYLIQGLANGIEDNTPLVTDAFDGTFLTITDTIDNIDRDALGTTLNDLIFNGSKAFSQTDTKWSRYGGSLVTSIKDGMVDNKNLLIDSGTTIAYTIIDTYLDAFEMDDIMSTSEVFYQIGASIAQSMNKGLLENLDPMLGGIGTALGHFSESSSTPSSYGYGNAEVKAVISPVIDSEALSKTGEEIKDFYDTVLRFDSNGNFVPYGYSGGSTGGFTKTSKTSTAVSRRNDEMLMRIYEAIVDDRDPKDPSNDKSSSEYNYTFNQYNTSPKALSESEIYRQTGNLFSRVKEVGQ